jgi:hypothetical protein
MFGGVSWKITDQGIVVQGSGLILINAPELARAQKYMAKYANEYAAASKGTWGVPVELLVACSMTESAPVNPETCVREGPGYVSDEQTPMDISAGFCQLLISTARWIMHDPKFDRQWLFNVSNSLTACAKLMKSVASKTLLDPILAACTYNAGGLYQNDGAENRGSSVNSPSERAVMPIMAKSTLASSIASGTSLLWHSSQECTF